MSKCIHCEHKFTLFDKIKSIKYACNIVKCSKCGSVYKRMSLKYSIIASTVAVIISLALLESVFKKMFWNQNIGYALAITVFVVLNDLLYFLSFGLGKRVKVDDSKYR